jgi:hypothetical protein
MPIKVLRDAGGLGESSKIEILKVGTCDSFEKVLRNVGGSGKPSKAKILKIGTCDSFLNLILE